MVKSMRRNKTLQEVQHQYDHQQQQTHPHPSIQRSISGRQQLRSSICYKGSVLTLLALAVYVTFQNAYPSSMSGMSDSLRILETTAFATTTTDATDASGVGSSGSAPIDPVRPPDLPYEPAPVEGYIMNHTVQLGFNQPQGTAIPTCFIWTDPQSTPYYHQLQDYYRELQNYYVLLNSFHLPPDIKDVRYDRSPHGDVCNQLEMHPQGLKGIFKQSQQLSLTSNGFVEPLIPPMRHPALCLEEGVGVPGREDKYPQLVQIRYLVHDWAHMCRKLLPTSRTVFIDMGASLQFHGNFPSPALVLLEQFRRFGIQFDHIYAYEMNPHDPKIVQNAIPKQYKSAYHWINVGVEPDAASQHNPWNLLLDHFKEDDLVIVKLDIDTPKIEHELAYQLLNNPRLAKLVDHFYFEHHVNQKELMPHWGNTMSTVEESFKLFHGLRQHGVASHFWV